MGGCGMRRGKERTAKSILKWKGSLERLTVAHATKEGQNAGQQRIIVGDTLIDHSPLSRKGQRFFFHSCASWGAG